MSSIALITMILLVRSGVSPQASAGVQCGYGRFPQPVPTSVTKGIHSVTTDLTIPGTTKAFDVHSATWEELQAYANQSFSVVGFTPIDKAELIGVPHVVTAVTFWTPKKDQLGMVSCEATVAGRDVVETAIRRHWVPGVESIDDLRMSPSERIVYNDGGTGLRRQVVMLLHANGFINVGHEDNETDSRFDTPWPEWTSFTQSRHQGDLGPVPHISTMHDGTSPFLLNCMRGLRVSTYTNEYTDEGMTYYFA